MPHDAGRQYLLDALSCERRRGVELRAALTAICRIAPVDSPEYQMASEALEGYYSDRSVEYR